MPPFVILHHQPPAGDARGEHWDLMLRHADALWTWALVEPPSAGRPIAADRLADHRLAYLQYEGPLSGNRGTVSRWDAGHYELLAQGPALVAVRLHGKQLAGLLTLTADPRTGQRWAAVFEPDEPRAV